MRVSEQGAALIKFFEGFRANAYPDPVGIWTIGYGFTQGVKPGDTITKEDADNRLKAELIRFENCVEQNVKVHLTQNEFDAVVSLVYNIGCGAFKMSSLLMSLNAGEKGVAADRFMDWIRAGGVILPGLVKRRMKERDLFKGWV